MNTENKQLSAEERQRLWNEVAAEEAGNGPAVAATSQAAEASAAAAIAAAKTPDSDNSATQNTPAADATGTTALTEATGTERFASLPQEVRDYMSGLETTVNQLAARVRSNEGSIGGLKSAMQRQREAAQAVRASGSEAPTESQIQTAQAGGKRAMDKLKEQYPEFGEQLDAALQEELATLRTMQPSAEQQPQSQTQQALTPEELAAARREAYIEGKGFKGWTQQIASPEFVGWFKRQPREVQMLGHSTDWDDSVRLLELHREQTTRQQQGAQQQGADPLNAFSGMSALHHSKSGGYQGTKTADQMTPAEFWKHLSEQENQQNQRG